MGLHRDEGVPRTWMSREEYLAWCDQQPEGRYERVDGFVVRMAAERGAHIRVKTAVFLALRRAVAEAGLDCQAVPDGAAVATGDSDFEPDALVNCGTPIGDEEVFAPNPVVIVEVLSPGTKSVDTGGKFAGYFALASVAHYLIVDPLGRRVVHHRRRGDEILTRIMAAGEIMMQPPGIMITVDELYAE